MKRLLVIALLIFTIQIQAQVRIGEEEAFSTAENFLKQNTKQQSPTLSLNEIIYSKTSSQPNLFLFSMEPPGFIIVSALNEVLAYSLTSTLSSSDELPDHINYWLDLYNKQTDYLTEHPDQARKPKKNRESVEPLLTSIWGQGCYHNAACPSDESGPCQHVEAGCIAIAMAQIMYYHKQPLTGCGSISYVCSPYGTLSANFGQTTYLWEQMADTLHESNPAVARLVYHCGISVKMKYSTQISYSSNSSAAIALRQFFFYPTSILCDRSNYDEEDWFNLIKSDLDQQNPVYYSGKSDLGGHAFVCDGYDNNGLFHFNFGWDGVGDGYYSLYNPYGFSTLQSCIHNIIPITDLPIQSDSHGIIYVSPEGSGNGSSWKNATSGLQLAIYNSHISKASIWVKEGTYSGEPFDGYTYNLFGDCQLYGGFKGDEPYDYDLSQRDFEAHPTILDGNHLQGVINVNPDYSNDTILIDGFTIQNGNASQGGGILVKSQTHIKNCKFRYNYARANGGGLSLQPPNNSGSAVVEDCEFYGNEAKNKGGGSYCHTDSNPCLFTNCTFSNNMAKNGGGIATNDQGSTFWNCLINNNTAETGGGCYLGKGTKLFNCTIVKNEAQTDYGGVYVSPSLPEGLIQNCIIWGNISPDGNTQIGPTGTYSYCAIEGDVSEKESNFKVDEDNDGALPRFYVRFQNANVAAGIEGQGGNWRLQPNSLCINRGINVTNQPDTDLDGNPRLKHENIDLGAYESDVAVHFIDAYYCENQPYYYQDSLLSELGIYTFFPPVNPHSNLVVIQMQEPPPSVFLTEEICENETYDFHGTLLDESGQYTTTVQCVTYELNLTVKPLDTISMEEEICEGDAYDFFGEHLYEAGHYSTIVDCKNYELDLTVNPIPAAPVFMKEDICEGESYNFFGRTLRYPGLYSTTLNCTTYNLDLDVKPLPEVHCSNDTLVEYGNPVQLTASGADSYLWSTGDTTQSITVFPVTDQTYTVRGFSQNRCSNEASVTVQVANETDKTVLYPNPADNKVKIYLPLIDDVDVFNLFGEPVYHVNANREAVELDVSQFADGIYIVQVKQMKNLYFEKLIVVH